jgi:hypothetical protein
VVVEETGGILAPLLGFLNSLEERACLDWIDVLFSQVRSSGGAQTQ